MSEFNSLQVMRTPELIGAEINNIKNQTRKMVLYNSIEIGRRLVEAKSLVAHGQWGEWLENTVDYSKSTANNLMRIFEEYGADQLTLLGDNAKSQALGNLSYTQAVALLGVPEEEREQFINEHDIDSMSTRELQEAIKERDKAKEELERAKQIAEEKNEEALRLLEEKQKAEADARVSERVLRETQEDVKRLQDTLQKEREEASKEITKLQESITDVKNQISEAQDSGDDEEVERLKASLKETESELTNSSKKIEELERQLKEQPIEVPATTIIEKVPEEIEKELNELRKKAKQSDATIKFSICFDELVKGFQKLLGTLVEIKDTDEEVHEKYKNAVSGLISKMSERL